MTRPLYETQEDLEREETAAQALTTAWGCAFHKLPKHYYIDFVFTRGELAVALCEIKTRNLPWSQIAGYGGYLMSLAKYMAARELNAVTGLPFVLAIIASDGLFYRCFTEFPPCQQVVMIGRTDRGDPQDVQPCFLLECASFKRLPAGSGSGVGV